MKKILIVEDDQVIRDELSLFLSRNGFECEIIEDFTYVIDDIIRKQPDLVLLDINLPVYDGYHICKEVRKSSDVPIIVVTSRNSDFDELMSMNFGADDYVTKPYNTQILLARIQSIFRRTSSVSDTIAVEGVTLYLSESSVAYNNQKIDVTKNELKILHVLMSAKGQVVTRDKIMDVLWQSNEFIDDNTLTVNINRLRKKLEGIGVQEFLKTKRGLGYMI